MSKKPAPPTRPAQAPNAIIARALGANYTPASHATVADAQVVLDLLGLVIAEPPTLEEIVLWTPEEREQVGQWAGREHLAASDNDDVERLPRPEVLARWYYGKDPVTTESSTEPGTPRSDVSSPEEEKALLELEAKLNAIQGNDVVVDAPRAEMFFVTVDGVSPLDLFNFVHTEEDSDSLSYYGVDAQALYLELLTFERQLVILLDRDPRVPLGEGSPSLLDLLLRSGYTILRVKRVVSAVREHETPLYYEGVVSLDGPMRTDRSGSCRDLYRPHRWYRVKRTPSPFDAQEWLAFATGTSKPSKAAGVTYGAVLLDTNPHLDTGWTL